LEKPRNTVDSQNSLSILAKERWHLLGGNGAPPDQATIHSDCIDDILSEYFEGEPEIRPDSPGDARVRFKSTLGRLFYVSEIWTEYDPDNNSWQTFYAKKTGDDPGGFIACQEDGSPLSASGLERFEALSRSGRRAFFAQRGAEANGLRVEFTPPVVGSRWLYAGVSKLNNDEAEQKEFDLLMEKKRPRRRGARILKSPALIVPPYVKQGQHLSNQLLGRPTVSSDPILFEKLDVEQTQDLLSTSIQAVGIKVDTPEFKAIEAGIKLLNVYRYKTKEVTVDPHQWYDVYGVEKYAHSKSGSAQYASKEKLQAVEALRTISGRLMLLNYRRRLEDGTWEAIEERAQLLQVRVRYYGISTFEVLNLNSELSHQRLDKIVGIRIVFHDIFLDQIAQHYISRPADLFTRVRLALGGKRPPTHLGYFITWILSDGEQRRSRNKREGTEIWAIEQTLDNLTHMCRLTERLKHGERKRILKDFESDAALCKKIGLITGYNFADEERLNVTLNPAQHYADSAQLKTDGEFPLGSELGTPAGKLTSEVKALMAQAQTIHPLVNTISNMLGVTSYEETLAIQSGIQRMAVKLLEADLVLSKTDVQSLIKNATERVHERTGGLRSPGKYFQSVLTNYLDNEWDNLKKKGRRLVDSAENGPRAQKLRESSQTFLTELSHVMDNTPR
jgi:hypothetical protein